MYCENGVQFGSGSLDQGGFGTAASRDVSALVKIPNEMSSAEAGPLMCAGATVLGASVQYGLKAGDTIRVVGVGGLGQLGKTDIIQAYSNIEPMIEIKLTGSSRSHSIRK